MYEYKTDTETWQSDNYNSHRKRKRKVEMEHFNKHYNKQNYTIHHLQTKGKNKEAGKQLNDNNTTQDPDLHGQMYQNKDRTVLRQDREKHKKRLRTKGKYTGAGKKSTQESDMTCWEGTRAEPGGTFTVPLHPDKHITTSHTPGPVTRYHLITSNR